MLLVHFIPLRYSLSYVIILITDENDRSSMPRQLDKRRDRGKSNYSTEADRRLAKKRRAALLV